MSDLDHEDHGHSLAAWVMVGIVILGSAVMAWAVAFPSVWLFVAGIGVVIAGLVAGKVLALAGYGAKGGDIVNADTDMA